MNVTLSQETMLGILPEEDAILLDNQGRMRYISTVAFYMMPLAIGIPQLVLNGFVFVSVVLMSKMGEVSGGGALLSSHKPAFIFIANLALADMLLVGVEVAVCRLQRTTHHHHRYEEVVYVDLEEPDPMVSKRRAACKMQLALWFFSIGNTMTSSVALTVDRYIYITRGLRYPLIMTTSKISGMLAFTWLFPLAWVLMSLMFMKQQYDSECIAGHLLPLAVVCSTLFCVLTIVATIYFLYFLILLKFFRRKRKMSQSNSMMLSDVARTRSMPSLGGGSGKSNKGRAGEEEDGGRTAARGSLRLEVEPVERRRAGEVEIAPVGALDDEEDDEGIQIASLNTSYDEDGDEETGGGGGRLSVPPSQAAGPSGNGGGRLRRTSISLILGPSLSASPPPAAVARLRSTSVVVARAFSSVPRFAKEAKYVLTLLLVFTVAWFPWIALLCRDVWLHSSGKWDEELLRRGCLQELPTEHSVRLQMCIFHAFNSESKSCVVRVPEGEEEGARLPLCRLIMEAAHAQRQDSFQKVSLVFGVTNSLLNPLVYGFWYSQFRVRVARAWKKAWRAVADSCSARK